MPKKVLRPVVETTLPSLFCWMRTVPLTVTSNLSGPGAPSVSGGVKSLLSSTALKLETSGGEGVALGSARNLWARRAGAVGPRPAA